MVLFSSPPSHILHTLLLGPLCVLMLKSSQVGSMIVMTMTMNMSQAAEHGAVQLSVQLEPGTCCSRRPSLLCLPSWSQAPAAVAGPPCSVCPASARHLLQSQALLALSVQLAPGTCCSRRPSLLCLSSSRQAPAAVAGPPCSVCPAGARHLLQSQALLALSVQLAPGTCCSRRPSLLCLSS